jgi:transcriptional regulator with XRE-family HTH domain
MPELGKTLSQARLAKGLTLLDVERDTRISRRYLDALEREDFAVFPAPVYQRAFLRTYAQYLGLDANELLRLFPQKVQEPVNLRPLPEVKAPPVGAVPFNWILTGGVLVALLVAAIFVFRTSERESPPPLPDTRPQTNLSGGAPGEGSVAPVTTPGRVPDLLNTRVEDATAILDQQGMPYVVIEVEMETVPEGVVFQQTPEPGTPADDRTSVTLVVSRRKR